jgi:hypothetical protein
VKAAVCERTTGLTLPFEAEDYLTANGSPQLTSWTLGSRVCAGRDDSPRRTALPLVIWMEIVPAEDTVLVGTPSW